MKNKRAAIEMTTGTIIVIVLSVLMLVFGSIFVQNIMCSGIVMADKISESTLNEITSLFGSRDFGVKCMGEGGQDATLGSGGNRPVVCVFNVDTQSEYKLTVDEIESLSGASDSTVEKWIVDKDWSGTVSPGNVDHVVLMLDIPREVSVTQLKLTITEENIGSGAKSTHTSYINIEPVGAFSAAIC